MELKILDLFSGRKREEKEKPKIIIDYREKNSLIPSILNSLGVEIELKELKVADYIVKDVAIEREKLFLIL